MMERECTTLPSHPGPPCCRGKLYEIVIQGIFNVPLYHEPSKQLMLPVQARRAPFLARVKHPTDEYLAQRWTDAARNEHMTTLRLESAF